MKIVICLAIACTLWAGLAMACEVEEWNHSDFFLGELEIFGVATCEEGILGIRLYDGEGQRRQLIGVGQALVSGYVFKSRVSLLHEPKSLSVRFGGGK